MRHTQKEEDEEEEGEKAQTEHSRVRRPTQVDGTRTITLASMSEQWGSKEGTQNS